MTLSCLLRALTFHVAVVRMLKRSHKCRSKVSEAKDTTLKVLLSGPGPGPVALVLTLPAVTNEKIQYEIVPTCDTDGRHELLVSAAERDTPTTYCVISVTIPHHS